jgi:hypothetical protein
MKASDDTEGKPRHLLVPRPHHTRVKKGDVEETKLDVKKGTQLVVVPSQKATKPKVESQKTPKVVATPVSVKK